MSVLPEGGGRPPSVTAFAGSPSPSMASTISSPARPPARAGWHLKKLAEPRKGTVYCVLVHKSILTCSCHDSVRGGAVCKHARAMVACGLLSKRAKPEAVIVAQNLATATTPKGGDL